MAAHLFIAKKKKKKNIASRREEGRKKQDIREKLFENMKIRNLRF